jgi:hypothetical protein
MCESSFAFSAAIYDGAAASMENGGAVEEDGACSHVGSVEPDLSVAGIVQAVAGVGDGEGDRQADSSRAL